VKTIVLTRNTGIAGTTYAAGTRIQVSDTDAQNLIGMGKAHLAPTVPALVVIEQASEVKASDAARKLAAEFGIDIFAIPGTGKDGSVTKADVRKAIEESGAPVKDDEVGDA
jgi:pyruvate/2-oxoglutarate dehydrogenase complex dihydrolipoamide acyltransferase (E2) component